MVATTCRRRACSRRREAGGKLLARAEVFDVYRGAQVGEGAARSRCGSRSARADRTLTDEDVAPARAKIVARSGRSSEASCVAERRRRRGRRLRGRAGGAARRPPPALRARVRRPRAPRPGSGWATSTRARACAELEEFDAERRASTRRSSPTRTARPRRPSPRCASAACAVIDLSRRLPPARLAVYEEWYGEHGAPELFGTAVYGLPELYRDELAAPTWSPARAATRRRRCWRSRRWPAGLIGDVIIDAKSGVTGAGRAATDATHFVTVNEDLKPYKVGGHRHRPEIEQELGRERASVPAAPGAARPRRAGLLLRARRRRAGRRRRRCTRDAYADEPFVEVSTARRACSRCARRTTAASRVHVDERTGQVIVFAAIDNLWKGTASQAVQSLNLMFGRPETEGLL